MSILQKALQALAKAKVDIKAELANLESELATLRRERDLTENLPRPRAEFLAAVEAQAGAHRAEYERILHALLRPLSKPGTRGIGNPLGLTRDMTPINGELPNFQMPAAGAVTEFALSGLLADVVATELRKSAERMPYPSETGLPEAERRERLRVLDGEIYALEAKATDLRAQLAQVGLRV